MEIAPRWARPWRWLVLLGAVALLAAVPAVVSALPVSAPSLPAAELLAKVRGSTATPYQGYAESRASLGLPDLPVVGRQTALLGAITRIRAWVASPTVWRVDELTASGERDLYQNESGTLEWDSGSNRVERTIGEPVVRFARAADLLPPELGRRLAAAAPGRSSSPASWTCGRPRRRHPRCASRSRPAPAWTSTTRLTWPARWSGSRRSCCPIRWRARRGAPRWRARPRPTGAATTWWRRWRSPHGSRSARGTSWRRCRASGGRGGRRARSPRRC